MSDIEHAGFFDENLIVHTHVEKSAGTAFVHGLKSVLGRNKIYETNSSEDFNTLIPEVRSHYRAVTGHFYSNHPIESPCVRSWDVSNKTKLIRLTRNRKKVRVVFVRDPIDRLLSLRRFVLLGSDTVSKEKVNHHIMFGVFKTCSSPKKLLERIEQEFPKQLNRHSDMITSGTFSNFDDVVRGIKNDYALVVPSNKVSEVVGTLSSVFGITSQQAPKVNVSNQGADDFDNELRALADVKSVFKVDFELLDYANSNYIEQINLLQQEIESYD